MNASGRRKKIIRVEQKKKRERESIYKFEGHVGNRKIGRQKKNFQAGASHVCSLRAKVAQNREESLQASLVIVTELDIVTKQADLAKTRARGNHFEASDKVL